MAWDKEGEGVAMASAADGPEGFGIIGGEGEALVAEGMAEGDLLESCENLGREGGLGA